MTEQQVISYDTENATLMPIMVGNRQVLIDHVNRLITDHINRSERHGDPYLTLSIDTCNSRVEYKTENDVPDKSVPCPCGNPKHWMIKYTDEKSSNC